MNASYPVTPDGRYFVVRGRLWRCTNPGLPDPEREKLTSEGPVDRARSGSDLPNGPPSFVSRAAFSALLPRTESGENFREIQPGGDFQCGGDTNVAYDRDKEQQKYFGSA